MFTLRLNTVTNWIVKYTHTYTLHYFLPQSWWNALLFKNTVRQSISDISSPLFLSAISGIYPHFMVLLCFFKMHSDCWCITSEFFLHRAFFASVAISARVKRMWWPGKSVEELVMDNLNRGSSDTSWNVCIKDSQNIETLKKKWELRCLLAILKSMSAVCAIRP